jgi:hypothetical protein
MIVDGGCTDTDGKTVADMILAGEATQHTYDAAIDTSELNKDIWDSCAVACTDDATCNAYIINENLECYLISATLSGDMVFERKERTEMLFNNQRCYNEEFIGDDTGVNGCAEMTNLANRSGGKCEGGNKLFNYLHNADGTYKCSCCKTDP